MQRMLRIKGIKDDVSCFDILVDGTKMTAYQGETVAAVLTANRYYCLGTTSIKQRPRGIYCGIGLCHECSMTINNQPNIRACKTKAMPGMRVETQNGFGRVS